MKAYEPDINEQQRIVIAATVIAAVAALYALPLTSTDLWSTTRAFMLFPGVFAFLFIVATGAHLKYKDVGTIGDFNVTHSMRRVFYNWMIDMFWSAFFLSAILFSASAFGWDGKRLGGNRFWLGLGLGAFMVLLLLILSVILWNKENKVGKRKK